LYRSRTFHLQNAVAVVVERGSCLALPEMAS
jgi:hypothetical protein